MDVVVPEKSQGEKVFRARKTMKTSDRHQLESIHNARSSPALPSSSSAPSSSSSPPSPAVVNGKSPDREEQTETEKVRESPADRNPRETRPSSPSSHSPSPLTLSLSLSPSPPSQTPELTSCSNAPSSPALSPGSVGKGRERDQGPSFTEGGETMADEKTDGGEGKEVEEGAGLRVKDKEDEGSKPGNDVSSPLDSPQDPVATSASPLASETKEGEGETETDKGTESEEAVAMDTDPASTETESVPAADTTSCPSLSPSHVPESDQEVKEGFLVLSEEDEAQGERGGGKEREKINRDGEQTQMEVCAERKEVGEDVGISAPSPSPALPPYGDTGGVEQCNSIPAVRKRARSKDTETDARRERGEEAVAVKPLGKRQKVEGELEAQLELKIRADGGTRIKLEEVVQQLVEERLRVLQLSVFDKSLQELRERVEKMDCATKHQQTINTLQAKIARLAKKFGAANQAKENVSSPQEVRSLQSAASTSPTSTTSTTSTFRPVETTVANQSNQTPPPRPLSATASPAQPKPLSTPNPPQPSPTGSAPTPSPVSTTVTSDTTPGLGPGASRTPPLQAGPALLPPLLTQLPLPLADAQGGTIGTKPRAGLEPIPVSTDSALDDAKTTTTGTSFKTTPSPSAPTLHQITPARGAHPGGGSVVGVPGAGGSGSSARPPTQCVPVVGVASSSTPGSGAGQPAVPGPPSVTGPDNQTLSFAASKPPAQAPRTSRSGAFIDLTEDDDDGAQGVKKAPVQSGSNAASSSFSCSSSLSSPAPSAAQRPAGPPPSPLISSSPQHGPAAGSTARSSPQSGLHTGNGPALPHRSPQNSPSKIRPATSVAGSSPAPAPSRPSPPPPALLPPPGGRTPPPQRPELKLARVHSDSGIVLSWCLTEEANLACAPLDSYHLYAYHQDRAGPPRLPPLPPLPPSSSSSSRWKKIGEVKALPLPMACTLTQFVAGSTYYFAVCAQDVRGRFGPFCEPQCTEVIGSLSSS